MKRYWVHLACGFALLACLYALVLYFEVIWPWRHLDREVAREVAAAKRGEVSESSCVSAFDDCGWDDSNSFSPQSMSCAVRHLCHEINAQTGIQPSCGKNQRCSFVASWKVDKVNLVLQVQRGGYAEGFSLKREANGPIIGTPMSLENWLQTGEWRAYFNPVTALCRRLRDRPSKL